LKFGSDTALYFRKRILAPFLAQYLKDGALKAEIAPVTAFETGTNEWRRYSVWPPRATDQRGFKHIDKKGEITDIGAYELL
jgi:predicted acyl esterase